MVRAGDGSIVPKLLKIDRPILRIPTLAIHLDRQDSFSFNKESQLFPIAGLVAAELNRTGDKSENASEAEKDGEFSPLKAITERHHPYLVELIASETGVEPADVLDFEMILFDTQKSSIGGLLDEFVFSARLDNLNSSFCATAGLIDSVADSTALDEESSIRLIALFDHEEIGSRSAQGADSDMLPAVIRRLSLLPSAANGEVTSTAYEQTLSTSFLISADMAHAVHPNYSAKYEPDHRPQINKGPVIKINANARYATNSPGIVLLQEVARKAAEDGGEGVPLQLFVVRNDSSCGSTIGPMLSAALGTRTLDLGNPQLSMHSIRETGGTHDVAHSIRLFSSFFQHYSSVSKTIFVD